MRKDSRTSAGEPGHCHSLSMPWKGRSPVPFCSSTSCSKANVNPCSPAMTSSIFVFVSHPESGKRQAARGPAGGSYIAHRHLRGQALSDAGPSLRSPLPSRRQVTACDFLTGCTPEAPQLPQPSHPCRCRHSRTPHPHTVHTTPLLSWGGIGKNSHLLISAYHRT